MKTIDRSRVAALMERERATFRQRHSRSGQLAAEAKHSLLFGVPMNWMTRWPGDHPVYVDRAQGARFRDVDGNEFIDFCLGDTGGMAGHAPKAAVDAIVRQARKGITLMLPTADAAWVGSELARRFGVPYWQFTLSATDANRCAIRWAREITGRPKIVVHNGCYHGTVDEAVATLDGGRTVARQGNIGKPVPLDLTTRVVEINDLAGLEAALAAGDVAACLFEPALTNIGIVLPDAGYHEAARALCTKYGTLLIIDETHTISAGPGGCTQAWGLEPDFVTIGKTLGAGIASGAYGMTERVRDLVYEHTDAGNTDIGGIGGTLAGNALSLAAMRATLGEVMTDAAFAQMIALGERFEQGVRGRDRFTRAALACRAARLPRRIPVPAGHCAKRHRGRGGPGRSARRVHTSLYAEPRHPDDAIPQHGADVAGDDRRGRGPAYAGIRGDGGRAVVIKRSLRCLWAALFACMLALASCTDAGRADRPPNIVVVLVDDLRWDDIAIAGHPFVETPNIDRLANEGARFLNAFAATPLCSPSRASILTGQYTHTHGIIDNTARDAASHALPTFAIPLEAAGYQTAFIGKWHMGNDDSRRPGWTRWVAMKGQGEAVNPKLNVDGERREMPGYVTDVLTDYTIDFLKKAGSKPFMVYLAHKAVHPNIVQRDDGSTGKLAGQPEGFVPAERHRGRYASAAVPRRPSANTVPVRKPALLREIPGLPPLGAATGTSDSDIRSRLEMLLAVDESLGRIVQTLDELGELDNTVIIFTSDHGYFYGEHGLDAERRLAYEETVRIPLIVRYPRLVRAGTKPAQMVQTIDLAPTILALAGVADTVPRDGISLVPLLEGSSPPWRSSILIEYYSDTVFPRILTMGYEAVRTEHHKYVHYKELPGMDELYDLQTDPFEMDNLIGSPKSEALLPKLQAELARLQRDDAPAM